MELATFLHISDLHIGPIKPGSRDSTAPRIWASLSWFDGLLGHSYRSLVHIRDFYRSMQPKPRLIVTGDFTTCCREEEFETAAEFLGSRLMPPKGNRVGLGINNWKELSIPGNHDHWNGHPVIFGGPGPALKRRFPSLPAVARGISLNSGHDLIFLCIDTDAGVWPYGRTRFYARGAFLEQLSALEKMLEPPRQKEIRVLLLHHSRAATGHILIITEDSRKALDDFVFSNGISVLLCGHVHQPPLLEEFPVTQHGVQRLHLEARSGTSSQRSVEPYEWRAIRNRSIRPGEWPNSLMVHRVIGTPSELHWESSIYLETPEGFVSAVHAGKPELRVRTVRIWPR